MSNGPYEEFAPTSFRSMLRRIERGEAVDGKALAAMLDAHPNELLPVEIRDYLARWLRREVKQRRGRKPPSLITKAWRDLAVLHYEATAAWLQKRRAASKGRYCKRVPETSWRDAAPHEIAVELVRRSFFPDLAHERVRNLLSSHQIHRNSRE